MNISTIKIGENIRKYGKKLVETKPYIPKGNIKYVSPTQNVSIGLTKSMPIENAKELILNTNIKLFSARDTKVPIKINGKSAIGEWIDGGGSKCAYRVNIDNEEFCILLPHNNWTAAMNEPQNTLVLKKLGLVTNDYCKIIPVEIEGQKIPALISKPYNKHSFKIFDKKNPNDDLSKYYNISKIREDNIEKVFSSLIKDVKILVDNDIRLAYDSFNLALKDGELRLYFNDLPYETLVKQGDKETRVQRYLEFMLDTIPSSISWHKIKENSFADSLNSMEGQNKIIPKLIELYNKIV